MKAMHFSVQWFSFTLGVLALAGCAHQLTPSATPTAYEINEQGLGMWRFGQTPAQIKSSVCPNLEPAGAFYVCKDTHTIDGKPRLVHATFNADNQLETVTVGWIVDSSKTQEPQSAWTQNMRDFLGYLQQHWHGRISIQFTNGQEHWKIDDINAVWKNVDTLWQSQENQGQPIGIVQPEQESSLPTRTIATGTLYSIRLTHQLRTATHSQETPVFLTQTSVAPSDPDPEENASEKRKAMLQAFSLKPPVPLAQLPGFSAFSFGMSKAEVEEAITRPSVSAKATCEGIETTNAYKLRCSEFPLMKEVRVTADFDFTPSPQSRLYGIEVHIAKPEGQRLNERSVQAAVGFLVEWMTQGMGEIESAGEGPSLVITPDNVKKMVSKLQTSKGLRVEMLPRRLREVPFASYWNLQGGVSREETSYKVTFVYRSNRAFSPMTAQK